MGRADTVSDPNTAHGYTPPTYICYKNQDTQVEVYNENKNKIKIYTVIKQDINVINNAEKINILDKMEGSETDQNKNNENNKYNTCMDIEKKAR